MLDQTYNYGCEFYGAQPMVGLTPVTDKCFLAMSQAVTNKQGAMLTGATAVGKTETIKVWICFDGFKVKHLLRSMVNLRRPE